MGARVLKECSSEIAHILAYIYTMIPLLSVLDWRQANVAPVFKKGEKYDAANSYLYLLQISRAYGIQQHKQAPGS